MPSNIQINKKDVYTDALNSKCYFNYSNRSYAKNKIKLIKEKLQIILSIPMDAKFFEIILQKDSIVEKNILNIHRKLDKILKILYYHKSYIMIQTANNKVVKNLDIRKRT